MSHVAWAVMLSDGRPYDVLAVRWEAQAIADALTANEGVSATVVPLSPAITDAEREAVEACAVLADKTDLMISGFGGQWKPRAATLRGLLERTK